MLHILTPKDQLWILIFFLRSRICSFYLNLAQPLVETCKSLGRLVGLRDFWILHVLPLCPWPLSHLPAPPPAPWSVTKGDAKVRSYNLTVHSYGRKTGSFAPQWNWIISPYRDLGWTCVPFSWAFSPPCVAQFFIYNTDNHVKLKVTMLFVLSARWRCHSASAEEFEPM